MVRRGHIRHRQIGNVVRHVRGAVDGVDIDSLLKRRRQPARDHGRSGDTMLPTDDASIRQTCGEAIQIHRPIDVVLNVFFARPYHLHRSVDLFGNQDGFFDEVRLQPWPEPAADEMVMHRNALSSAADPSLSRRPPARPRPGLGMPTQTCATRRRDDAPCSSEVPWGRARGMGARKRLHAIRLRLIPSLRRL